MDWIKVGIIIGANLILLGWSIYERKRDKKIFHYK